MPQFIVNQLVKVGTISTIDGDIEEFFLSLRGKEMAIDQAFESDDETETIYRCIDAYGRVVALPDSEKYYPFYESELVAID